VLTHFRYFFSLPSVDGIGIECSPQKRGAPTYKDPVKQPGVWKPPTKSDTTTTTVSGGYGNKSGTAGTTKNSGNDGSGTTARYRRDFWRDRCDRGRAANFSSSLLSARSTGRVPEEERQGRQHRRDECSKKPFPPDNDAASAGFGDAGPNAGTRSMLKMSRGCQRRRRRHFLTARQQM
jgi:hypothetical protein